MYRCLKIPGIRIITLHVAFIKKNKAAVADVLLESQSTTHLINAKSLKLRHLFEGVFRNVIIATININ